MKNILLIVLFTMISSFSSYSFSMQNHDMNNSMEEMKTDVSCQNMDSMDSLNTTECDEICSSETMQECSDSCMTDCAQSVVSFAFLTNINNDFYVPSKNKNSNKYSNKYNSNNFSNLFRPPIV